MLTSRLDNLTVHQLRVFCAVARHLSYTRAAAALGCRQPTASALVAHLEEMTHLTLFEQQGKRLILTNEGHELYDHAQQVVSAADDLLNVAAQLHGGGAALSIAADTTVGTYVMPHLLGEFRQQHPEIRLHFHVANRAGVQDHLLNHLADLVIAGRVPEADGLVVEPFLTNELVVVAAADHPLVGHDSVPLTTLAAERFVLREEGSGTRAAIEKKFEKAGLPLKHSMVLGHIEAIKQAVIIGLGISVISKEAIKRELREGTLMILKVEGFPIQRHWYITRLEAHPLSPSALAFIDILRLKRQRHLPDSLLPEGTGVF